MNSLKQKTNNLIHSLKFDEDNSFILRTSKETNKNENNYYYDDLILTETNNNS